MNRVRRAGLIVGWKRHNADRDSKTPSSLNLGRFFDRSVKYKKMQKNVALFNPYRVKKPF